MVSGCSWCFAPVLFVVSGGIAVAGLRSAGGQPLSRHLRTSRSPELPNLFVGQTAWTSQETTDRDLVVVAFASDQVIHANGLVQMNRLGLADQHPMLVLRSGVVGIITWVLDDGGDRPHTNEVSGALVHSPEILPRRDYPEPISGQEVGKDTVVGMPPKLLPLDRIHFIFRRIY